MSNGPSDLEDLRRELRAMGRGDLLIIAERAAELIAPAKLAALFRGYVRIGAQLNRAPVALLEDVQKLHSAALAGKYYQAFDVNWRNCTQHSAGTDAFIAEFDRLSSKCVRAANTGPASPVREAFELLFGLLRHIDQDPDAVVFFADEAGSWQVGVDFRTVFPAYFRCLAETAAADEFATAVNRVIADFADHERPHHLAAARKVANAAQRVALRALPKGHE